MGTNTLQPQSQYGPISPQFSLLSGTLSKHSPGASHFHLSAAGSAASCWRLRQQAVASCRANLYLSE